MVGVNAALEATVYGYGECFMSLEGDAQKLLLAAFLNYASSIFTTRGEELKEAFTKLTRIASMLRPEIATLLEEALSALNENPSLADDISSRIELGGISPYASDYVTDADKIRLKSEISGLYRNHGIRVREEMPDHIAPMLQLFSFLKVKEAYLEAKGDSKGAKSCEETIKLLKTYLEPTVKGLSESIKRYSDKAPQLAVLEAVNIIIFDSK
ncbi:MAG: hypothetical protein DJ555_05055 [Desulfurococcaceae archaeon]|jgi:hypothetical protein|nr:MAG: hypothetical protein DJ555_05055 [Desulfurococcaceae archaeon]